MAKSNLNSREGADKESIKWGFAEHLKYSMGVDSYTASHHDKYMALALSIRDRLTNQWIRTQQTHHNEDVKRVYYLSLEFLMGRAMGNNVINLGIEDAVRGALKDLGYTWEELRHEEVDAGLGNGGLGRLAACFLDSLASLNIPAFGYGLRYDYGIFKQVIENGHQQEHPDDWLRQGNPWEIERPDISAPVRFGGSVNMYHDKGQLKAQWVDGSQVIGIAYDTPIVGFNGETVNTLRLWSAKAAQEFDFGDFNEGDYVEAVSAKVNAENLTKVLYPNDKLYLGKELRLKQQYLFVASSLWDIVRRFKKSGHPWTMFPQKAAIQLNDTHPSLAVPELMRILVDIEGIPWDGAWDIVVQSMGYTNHTLMPEALEKWPVPMLEQLLPRHLQIIYEINRRFLQKATICFPGELDKISRLSLVEEGHPKQIRMANMSIVGTHSTNGVAELHTKLLKENLVPDFADIFPERFNNKTNGITQRRWLLKSNPGLSKLISDTIGDAWITDFDKIADLKPYAEDPDFQKKFMKVKQDSKKVFAQYLKNHFGWEIDSKHIFDFQVKRIHEYKRQLLNALNVVMEYNRIRKQGHKNVVGRTYFIGGKAAPGYYMAKMIIKLINNISNVVNNDPAMGGKLKLYFLPNYRVSLAEKIFPAADVSEQISTAGTEASGTGNMKFMCNGALTVGTLDGANIEIVEEVGEENAFIFGLKTNEVNELRPDYDPYEYYSQNAEIKEAIDLLFSGHFNINELHIFEPIRQMLFDQGDNYMNLADLNAYHDTQQKISKAYKNKDKWAKMAILNIASSGKFSSDRTIKQYADEVWQAKPCKIEKVFNPDETLAEAKRTK